MSAIDFEINRFLGKMASLFCEIQDSETWVRQYVEARKNYPEWRTKDGILIKVENVDDNHLNNLISFLERKKDDSGWLKAFKCEKHYRELKKEIPRLKTMYNQMEEISFVCLLINNFNLS